MGDDDDPKDNLVQGMEAVWTFKRLKDDLYLILNGADGNGFRCFGFQRPNAPYPTFLVWQSTQMEAASGTCGSLDTVCTSDLDCQPVTLTVDATTVDFTAGDMVEMTTTDGDGVVTTIVRGKLTADAAAGATSLTVVPENDGTFDTSGTTTVSVGTTANTVTV